MKLEFLFLSTNRKTPQTGFDNENNDILKEFPRNIRLTPGEEGKGTGEFPVQYCVKF